MTSSKIKQNILKEWKNLRKWKKQSASARIRETKIRLHHWAQIDFVIKVREFTKLRHMLIQNKTKTKIFSEHFVMRFRDP